MGLPEEISVAEFEELIPRPQLIDVRTAEEFAEGHIPGAINFDVRGENFSQQLGRLEREEAVVLYCGGGRRGGLAREKASAMGFKNAASLKGGFKAWKAEGKGR